MADLSAQFTRLVSFEAVSVQLWLSICPVGTVHLCTPELGPLNLFLFWSIVRKEFIVGFSCPEKNNLGLSRRLY